MQRNSLGTGSEGAPTDNATRKNAGEAANKDNATNNAGTQRDGTPTNLGVKPTNPGKQFFKTPAAGPVSGMEKAMSQKFKR